MGCNSGLWQGDVIDPIPAQSSLQTNSGLLAMAQGGQFSDLPQLMDSAAMKVLVTSASFFLNLSLTPVGVDVRLYFNRSSWDISLVGVCDKGVPFPSSISGDIVTW